DVAPIVQAVPVQLSENRLVDPSGVRPSGVADAPPPTSSPPQFRFFMWTLDPSLVSPQTPVGSPLVKSRMPGGVGSVNTSAAKASALASMAATSIGVRQSLGTFA